MGKKTKGKKTKGKKLKPDNPVCLYVPRAMVDEKKLRAANTMTYARICKLSIISRVLYGRMRSCCFLILAITMIMLDVGDSFARACPFLFYDFIITVFIVGICLLFGLFCWYGAPLDFNYLIAVIYNITYPKIKCKYTIKKAYLVAENGYGFKLSNNYFHVVSYQDEEGRVEQAYTHIDNYEIIARSKFSLQSNSNLPLTIVTVQSMWPHKTRFAFISSFYSFKKGLFRIGKYDLYDC